MVGMKKMKNASCGIGGQAVIEGVMMKNKERYAVAVRKPDHTIEVMTDEYKTVAPNKKLTEIPFVRGVFNFIDSLVLGMKILSYSASFYEDEEDRDKEKKSKSWIEKVLGEKAESVFMGCTIFLSVLAAIGLFMILPYIISTFLGRFIDSHGALAILEGILRLTIFIGYVFLISLMKDIKRVYQYHGAEHKCISCIERGYPLTVDNVRKSSKEHKRCGTSFMLFVMVVSILFFFFIKVENPFIKMGLRVVLIPFIAGVSYEIIRLAGKTDHFIVNILSAPGLWLQRLTTKEPDDQMIEVAIAAVEEVFDWKAYFQERFDSVKGYRKE